MKEMRYTEEQIAFALRKRETGASVPLSHTFAFARWYKGGELNAF
jgi:hypothetical protein